VETSFLSAGEAVVSYWLGVSGPCLNNLAEKAANHLTAGFCITLFALVAITYQGTSDNPLFVVNPPIYIQLSVTNTFGHRVKGAIGWIIGLGAALAALTAILAGAEKHSQELASMSENYLWTLAGTNPPPALEKVKAQLMRVSIWSGGGANEVANAIRERAFGALSLAIYDMSQEAHDIGLLPIIEVFSTTVNLVITM
jgi:hypothetical protein